MQKYQVMCPCYRRHPTATLNAVAVQDPELSRRERNTLRTRRQIVRAACELVLEDGYERATIARIAERADLATRTVTTRFASKEDIFFGGMDEHVDRAERHLADAAAATPSTACGRGSTRSRRAARRSPRTPRSACCAAARSPATRTCARCACTSSTARTTRSPASVAADTGLAADASGPQMIAAAAIAMFEVVERLAAEGSAEALTELERGFSVLRGALGALT